MRNGSYTSCVITGHLFSFNKKMRIVVYFDREPVRIFKQLQQTPVSHPYGIQETTAGLTLKLGRFSSNLLYAVEV